MALYSRDANYTQASISYPNFLDWVRDNRSFSALAAYRGDDFNLTGMGEPERVPAEMISASFFPLLGVRPRPRADVPSRRGPGGRGAGGPDQWRVLETQIRRSPGCSGEDSNA